MSTNEIFVDSTCLFSQRSLLDSITNPNDDVVVFLDWNYIHAWNRMQMCEFAVVASQIWPSLCPCAEEELYSLNNPIVRLLLKEQELLEETIGKLKALGLVKVISHDDIWSEVNETYRVSGAEQNDVLHKLRRNVLTAPKGVQNEMRLVPSDLDTIAYAVASGKKYHSENESIRCGDLAKVMGARVCEVKDERYLSLENVGIADIEAYIEDKKGYMSRLGGKIHRGHKKLLRLAFDIGCAFIPGASALTAIASAANDVADISESWSGDKKFVYVETRRRIVQENKIQPVIENFSAYRMNPIKRAREV